MITGLGPWNTKYQSVQSCQAVLDYGPPNLHLMKPIHSPQSKWVRRFLISKMMSLINQGISRGILSACTASPTATLAESRIAFASGAIPAMQQLSAVPEASVEIYFYPSGALIGCVWLVWFAIGVDKVLAAFSFVECSRKDYLILFEKRWGSGVKSVSSKHLSLHCQIS